MEQSELQKKWLPETRSGKPVTLLEIFNGRIFGRIQDNYKSWDENGNELEGMRGAYNDLILNTEENKAKLATLKELQAKKDELIEEINKLNYEL